MNDELFLCFFMFVVCEFVVFVVWGGGVGGCFYVFWWVVGVDFYFYCLFCFGCGRCWFYVFVFGYGVICLGGVYGCGWLGDVVYELWF